MTKIYDLIYRDNQIYMVDMNQKNNQPIGTWVWNDEDNSIYKTNIKSTGRHTDNIYTISAATDSSLNLPLLPQIEEVTEFNMLEEYPDFIYLKSEDYKEAFKNYKAAKAKKYTEEDMREVAWNSYLFAGLQQTGESWSDWYSRKLQSLNPLPKKVEVEWVPEDPYSYDSCNNISTYKPKTVNNYVQVKRWIYE